MMKLLKLKFPWLLIQLITKYLWRSFRRLLVLWELQRCWSGLMQKESTRMSVESQVAVHINRLVASRSNPLNSSTHRWFDSSRWNNEGKRIRFKFFITTLIFAIPWSRQCSAETFSLTKTSANWKQPKKRGSETRKFENLSTLGLER